MATSYTKNEKMQSATNTEEKKVPSPCTHAVRIIGSYFPIAIAAMAPNTTSRNQIQRSEYGMTVCACGDVINILPKLAHAQAHRRGAVCCVRCSACEAAMLLPPLGSSHIDSRRVCCPAP